MTDWASVVDGLVPVCTLLLGAGLTRGTRRGDARHDADVELAEITRFLWAKFKTDQDYIDLQVALAKLGATLRRAGVPYELVSALKEAGRRFWIEVQDSRDPEIGLYIHPERSDQFDQLVEAVQAYLHRPWRRSRNKQLRVQALARLREGPV